MKKTKIYCLIILLTVVCGLTSTATEKNLITIFDFTDELGRKSENGKTFNLLLFAELSKYESVKMVERKRLEQIMEERKLNRSALVNRQYFELASLLNADYIVTGRIYFDFDEQTTFINLKLTRCADNKICGKCFYERLPVSDILLEKIAVKAATYIKESLNANGEAEN